MHSLSVFFARKIIVAVFGAAVALGAILFSIYFIYHVQGLMHSEFTRQSILLGLLPVSVFFVSRYYNATVVIGIRQMLVEMPRNESLKMSIRSYLQDALVIAKAVPGYMLFVSCSLAVTIVPSVLSDMAINTDSLYIDVVASLIIAFNLLYFSFASQAMVKKFF